MRAVLRAAAAAAALGFIAPAAQAGTASNNFTVSVTLTSQCTAGNTGTQTVAFGTYIAFQAAAQPAPGVGLTVTCTRGFSPVSTAFDVSATGTAAGVGVIQGLQYTLTTTGPTTTAGTAATTATIGTGDTKTYTVSGSMPSGQAGTCAGASCGPTTVTRTLIVTF